MSEKKNGKTNGHSKKGFFPTAPLQEDPSGNGVSHSLEGVENFFSVTEELTGRRILITGTTGFLGKVVLSMLLRFHADLEKIYVVIRGRRTSSAENRFYSDVATSGALQPLQESYGAGYEAFLRDKIEVLDGDLTRKYLGIEEEKAREISSHLDLFINSAGLTNFNPNLRSALEINTLSNLNILDFIRLGDCHARLLHTSTSFVAGKQSRRIAEVFPGPERYPHYEEIKAPFDHEKEIKDCLKLIEHFEEISLDQEHRVRFVQEAREAMRKNNLNPGDEDAFEEVCEKIRLKWVKDKLSHEGRERASFWGWPNIYTYTKSMGERILAASAHEIDLTICRPAIIESAVEYPQPSWNEGINTTAPIAFLMYKGHRLFPTRDGNLLDVIPVDHVAGAMIAIGAALLRGEQQEVYHLGSSDLNPITSARLAELTALSVRRLYDREVHRPGWQKLLLKNLDVVIVSEREFNRKSSPGINKAVKALNGLLGGINTRALGGVGQAIDGVRKGLRSAEKLTLATSKIFELFLPFIHDNNPIFVAQNVKNLSLRLHPGERARYGCPVDQLDWRAYWIDIHLPGLSMHAFPALEAKLKESRKEAYTYEDLVELFDASTTNFSKRLALQHHAGGIQERYTYGELKERTELAARSLVAAGVGPGRTVLLASENRPQWPMAYFGILKAGGIAVPIDSESTVDQLLNICRSARGTLILLSDLVYHRCGEELGEALKEAGLPTRIMILRQLFQQNLSADLVVTDSESSASTEIALTDSTSDEVVAELIQADNDGDPLASLIFTSGTTGDPKAVMLSHSNFTHLVSSLSQTFPVNERDGFLSVLPLHHTFEFACGLLMPLSRGSSITYMEELSGEELSAAMQTSRITALIGVPALWQLLHRRIEQKIDDAPPSVRTAFELLNSINTSLRERMGINLGRTLFGAVHQAFGGRLKYMISGGAALPEKTLEAFYGMGFNLYEGYGLTEAAPVLTVNTPAKGLLPGSVGQALPGMEVKIKDPDDAGVGEIVARGPNVMRGYLGKPEETSKAVQGEWLHTGDLGTLDSKGNLTIVGREKEVIITAGGKNAYPDELEDIYGKAPHVAELSIVGLPDHQGSERIACLVRPDLEDKAQPADVAEARSAIREWIRVEGSRVPSHNRIQVLRFWDQELPRTATRKVKRREVVKILQRLLDAEMEAVDRGEVEDTTWAWLDKALGTLADFDPARVHNNTHLLDDLGFDSLMFVELSSILAARDFHITPEVLAQIPTVGELQELLSGDAKAASTALVKAPPSTIQQVESYDVPKPIAKAVKNLLYNAQMSSYDTLFNVDVFGRAHIPYHNPNVIVIANHCSHLDMGLVKYALGDYGVNIRAVAAADYFFKNKVRKTYFGNFTNLLPLERSGTLKSSLGAASQALIEGEMLLVFPEGTRSKDGKIQDFRRGLGYLVDSHNVDILPLWLDGTHRALPKGQPLPNPASRKLKVHIGPVMKASELRKQCSQMGPNDRYQFISDAAQRAVLGLRDAALGGGKKPETDTLTPLFEELNLRFAENQVDSPLSFYFSLGAWDSHKWTISVDPLTCKISNSKPNGGKADCVIKTSPEIFRKIVKESYVPSMGEFMNGVIKTNDPNLLMRFQSVFNL